MKKGKLKLGVLLPWLLLCLCSATSFTFLDTYPGQFNILAIDQLGNFYAAGGTKLFKFSAEGKFLYPYEEHRYGDIGMVDVNNPLKALVFYPDFLTVVTLDNFLSPLTTYNFFNLGYQSISAVASSTDGHLWFYDNTDFKLKKIDELGTVYLQSQPLNLVLQQTINPNFITERETKVYMNDPDIGIIVFDPFGSYEKTVPIKGLQRFQVMQDEIIYFDNRQMNSFNMVTLDLKSLTIPDSIGVLGATIGKNQLGILKKDKVDFYRY